MSESVKVVVRCRPFNQRELGNASSRCITMNAKDKEVIMRAVGEEPEKSFVYDAVYDSE